MPKKQPNETTPKSLETLLALPEPNLSGVSSDMVYHIAMGLEDPADVALRYGFEGQGWEKLKNSKAFQVAVKQAQAELEENGINFKNKAKLMAGDLKEMFFRMAKSGELSPGQAMRFWETLIRVAGLEPKNEPVAADTGAKFSVNINLGSSTPQTIDVTAKQIEEE